MTTVEEVGRFLEEFAPLALAESWDNVGLLVGERRREVKKIMTCLTITPASADEAVRESVDLIVAHHPLPFKPLKRLTSDTTAGRLLLSLIRAGVAVYSPHTAFDSAAAGINQTLAEGLGLKSIEPLAPSPAGRTEQNGLKGLGAGRLGTLAAETTLGEFAQSIKRFLKIERLQLVGDPEQALKKVGVACGSAGEFLEPARQAGCQLLVTGETNFHTCLEAEATGVGLALVGHFASERFGVERLAEVLAQAFPRARAWPSYNECDPIQTV